MNDSSMKPALRTRLICLICISLGLATLPVHAQTVDGAALLQDAKLYVTAPLRWDQRDWWFAGGSVAAIVVAHHYDTQVRAHFVTPDNINNGDKHSGRDWLPTVGVIGATWGLAWWSNDQVGRRETAAMLEAGAFSGVTTLLSKSLIGRSRPDQTDNTNDWFKRGDAFPSSHVSVAFAVGTVLAESGNDELRWVRRVLGYGLGAGTAYLRLRGNAHWLSDTVAAAALGNATARFVMRRRYPELRQAGEWQLLPDGQGLRLSYNVNFH